MACKCFGECIHPEDCKCFEGLAQPKEEARALPQQVDGAMRPSVMQQQAQCLRQGGKENESEGECFDDTCFG